MYKITLHFQSNEIGIYTTEIETATEEQWVDVNRKRMLSRWFKILFPHIDVSVYIEHLLNVIGNNLPHDIEMDLIQSHLATLNMLNAYNIKNGEQNKRKFRIDIEEI